MKSNIALIFILILNISISFSIENSRKPIRKLADSSPKLIWLDCDPGINIGVLDDAIALIVASQHANVKLLGVSTVAGNTDIDSCNKNALNILNFIGVDVPVIAGSSRPILRDRYEDTSATKDYIFPSHNKTLVNQTALSYIYETLKNQTQKVTLIGLGPDTNLALLLRTYPDVSNYIAEIILLGGAIGIGNVSPAAEFNVWCDPDSTKIIVNSGLNVTMVPLDVTATTGMSTEILEAFKNNTSSEFGNFLWTYIDFQQQKYPDLFMAYYSMFHDAVVVVYAIDPSIFTVAKVNVDVDVQSSISYGRTLCDLNNVTGNSANVNLATAVDNDGYWNIVMPIIQQLHQESLTMIASKKKNALIVIDPQNDFVNGSLAITNATEYLKAVNQIRKTVLFDYVYLTADWHPTDHVSFASSHPGKNPYENITLSDGRVQELWPDHCVRDSLGAQFHESLDRDNTEIIIHKGTLSNVESYGGFGTKPEETGLEESLKSKGVGKIFTVGLALDFCIKSTAIEGKNLGFESFVVDEGTAKIFPENKEQHYDELKNNGVKIISSSEISSYF